MKGPLNVRLREGEGCLILAQSKIDLYLQGVIDLYLQGVIQ